MKARFSTPIAAALVLACAAGVQASDSQVDLQAQLANAKKYTAPNENHKKLERFLGQWDTEVRLFLPDGPTAPEKGTATGSWLMEGRWLKFETKGSMMGMPMSTFMILGYDNFKMSYVSAMVNSYDTAMTTAEGDMDPSDKAMLSYGTIDEYLTGEHDKMVKYVWRLPNPDELVLEVHDLPIGENNTKVVEFRFKRHKN